MGHERERERERVREQERNREIFVLFFLGLSAHGMEGGGTCVERLKREKIEREYAGVNKKNISIKIKFMSELSLAQVDR